MRSKGWWLASAGGLLTAVSVTVLVWPLGMLLGVGVTTYGIRKIQCH